MGQSFQSKPAISLLVLVASASCAPQYGPPPPLPSPTPIPEKLIAPVTPAIACTVTYVTVWDTEYHDNEKEVCVTEYEKVCNTELQRLCQPTTRQECTTHYEQQCSTIYKNVCVQKYRTEYEPYTETECTTEYKQDCQYEWQGEGNDKCGLPSMELARMFPTTSARTSRKPTPGKLPMRLAMRNQRRRKPKHTARRASPRPPGWTLPSGSAAT